MLFTCVAYKKQVTPNWRSLNISYFFTRDNSRPRLAKSSYFLYNNLHRCMKSKGRLYIYIHQVFDKSQIIFFNKYLLQYTGEELHVSRTVIVFGLSKARKVIRQNKFMSCIMYAIGHHFTFYFINNEVLVQKFHVKI
jgi:hypothetical protein